MITYFAEFQAHTIWLSCCRLSYSLGYMISDFLFTGTWLLFTGTWHLTVCLQLHATWLFVHRYMTSYFLFTVTRHLTVHRYVTSDFLFTGTWYLTVCLQVHDIWLFVYRHIIFDFLFCTKKYNIWRPWWRTTDVHGCQGPLEEGQCRH